MLGAKSKLQIVNRIMIFIFSLMLAYAFTWPFAPNNTSHMLDDRSYGNCHGTLARPLEVDHRDRILNVVDEIEGREITHEYETLPAGTEIIYIFIEDKPHFVNLYTEQGMMSSVLPHEYIHREISEDDLVNPEEIEQNLTRIKNVSAERQAEYEAARKHYKYMFVPIKLVYAIPAGIVIFALLWWVESKYSKPHAFTIEMTIILLLTGCIEYMLWDLISAACR